MRENGLSRVENFVAEEAVFVVDVDLMKIIHVELTDERGDFVVAEVAGQDLSFEPALVMDPDALLLRVPPHDLGVLL